LIDDDDEEKYFKIQRRNEEYTSSDDDFFGASRQKVKEKKEKKEKKPKEKKEKKSKKRDISQIADTDGFVYSIKKKRTINPDDIVIISIPPDPIPYTWAKLIVPYQESKNDASNSKKIVVNDIIDLQSKTLPKHKFQGILIDPPWLFDGMDQKDHPDRVLPEEFENLSFLQEMEAGFLFMWIEKEFVARTVKVLMNFNFLYVENLVWVKQAPNNQLETQHYPFFRKSKATLFIFKKGEGIELRHQRNPDTVYEFVKNGPLNEEKPLAVYKMIETLLPTSKFDNADGFKLLELWSKYDESREGWISVSLPNKK